MPDTTPPPVLSATVLTELFAKIDPRFSHTNMAGLFSVTGADEAASSLALFNMLRRLVLGETDALPTGESAAEAQQAALDRLNAALDTGLFSGQLVSLVGQTGQQIAALAMSQVGVRYSIENFVPFAILGAAELYARHNADGHLTRFDPATGATRLSSEWLTDRSQLFAARLAAGDGGSVTVGGNQSWVIEDRSRRNADGSAVRLHLTAENPTGPNGRVTFGTDDSAGEIVAGGAGSDRLYGGGGDDNMRGGAGDDYLEGGDGNDSLDGGIGNDTLVAGDGDDEIDGGIGNDIVRAGEGDDVIAGGRGDDRLDGGNGFDTYIVEAGDGNDVIIDSDGLGQILYAGSALTGATDVRDGKYVSADGKLTFSFAGDLEEGGVLTITTENGRIKIRDFRNGMLGIRLGDGSQAALFPPNPPVDTGGGTTITGPRGIDTQLPVFSEVMYPDASWSPGMAPPEEQSAPVNGATLDKNAIDWWINPSHGSEPPYVTGADLARVVNAGFVAAAAMAPAADHAGDTTEAAIGITVQDVTHAAVEFHDAHDDASLGGDTLIAHLNRQGEQTPGLGGDASTVAGATPAQDIIRTAPRIGG